MIDFSTSYRRDLPPFDWEAAFQHIDDLAAEIRASWKDEKTEFIKRYEEISDILVAKGREIDQHLETIVVETPMELLPSTLKVQTDRQKHEAVSPLYRYWAAKLRK